MLYGILSDIVVLIHLAFAFFCGAGCGFDHLAALGRLAASAGRFVGNLDRTDGGSLSADPSGKLVAESSRAGGLSRRFCSTLPDAHAVPG